MDTHIDQSNKIEELHQIHSSFVNKLKESTVLT